MQLEQVVVEVVEVQRLPFAFHSWARPPYLDTQRLQPSFEHRQFNRFHFEGDVTI